MALLQLVSEEEIAESLMIDYFEDLYKVVCVSERPESTDENPAVVRTTYLVDWEQLVHLLEDYTGFGEDIVQVIPVTREEAGILKYARGTNSVARA